MAAVSWTRRLPLLAAALAMAAAVVAASVAAASPAAGVAVRAAADAAAPPPAAAVAAAAAPHPPADAVAAASAPTVRQHVSPEGRVWVSPTLWNDFLAKAEAALRSTSLPDGQVAATLGALRSTPAYGHSGWVYFDSMAAWEALGKVLARAMSGAPDGRVGRSGWCAQQAAACGPWWNFSGCTSRTYCCCPPYCDTVFSGFWPLTVAAGRKGSVHACCVESFC